MRRHRRWLGALLGGLVLPFDPLLGLILVTVGLWRPSGGPRAPRQEA